MTYPFTLFLFVALAILGLGAGIMLGGLPFTLGAVFGCGACFAFTCWVLGWLTT